MARSRIVLAGVLVLLALALTVPAVSLAGGSAGDQQYTDPFSGGSGGGSHTASSTTSSAPAPTSTAAPTTSSLVPPTTVAATTTPADPTTSVEPTATMATSSPMLPNTGYDAWTAVGFGLTMVAAGAALRWHVRARRG